MSVHRDPTNDRRATPRPGAPPPNGRAAGAAPAPLPVGPEERDRVSHELRTPLNAILGYAELLLDGSAGPLSAQARECAAHIQDAGRRLLHEVETWHRRADQRATPPPRPNAGVEHDGPVWPQPGVHHRAGGDDRAGSPVGSPGARVRGVKL